MVGKRIGEIGRNRGEERIAEKKRGRGDEKRVEKIEEKSERRNTGRKGRMKRLGPREIIVDIDISVC